MPSLYDLLPEDVKAKYPPESLDTPAARVLLRPNRIPADYDPDRAAELGGLLAEAVPRMTEMRAMTNRIRAAQQAGPQPPTAENTTAPGETATAAAYRRIQNIPMSADFLGRGGMIPAAAIKAAARIAVAAAPNVSAFLPPARRYSTRTIVPPAASAAEHAADVIGSLLGFTTRTAGLAAIPGASAAGAAGVAAMTGAETPKEAAISGPLTAATAGATGLLGSRAAAALPGIAGKMAAHAVAAGSFGAALPWADREVHRLTGEKPPPFTGWDAAKGTLEMAVVNLLAHGANARLSESVPEPVARRAAVIADAVRPPRGLRPQDAAASRALSDRLNTALSGKRAWLDLPGGGRGAAAIQRVIAYRMPDGSERIHLIVADPVASIVPLTYHGVGDLLSSLKPPPGQPRLSEVPQTVESVPPQAAAGALPALRGMASAQAIEQFPASKRVRGEMAATRIEQLDRQLAGLEKSRPGKGDKGYRRWAQRVGRLTTERDALRERVPPAARLAPEPPALTTEAAETHPPLKAVAQRLPDGTVVVGKPGQVHADLNTPGQAAEDGYVTQAGDFITRAQAYAKYGLPDSVGLRNAGIMEGPQEPYAPAAVPAAEPALPTERTVGGQAVPIDRGAAGKEGIEHPPMRDVAIAELLSEPLRRGEFRELRQSGATDAQIEAKIRSTLGEGGGSTSGKVKYEYAGGEHPLLRFQDESGRTQKAGIAEFVKAVRDALLIPQPKATGLPPGAGSEVAVESRFKGGERVRIPNYTNRRHDKRATVPGTVIGHETINGEAHVVVDVQRGKGTSRHTVPERLARKAPTLASRKAITEKKSKMRASIEARAGGDYDKATAIAAELRGHAERWRDKAGELYPQGREQPTAEFEAAKRQWRKFDGAAQIAEGVASRIYRAAHPEAFAIPAETHAMTIGAAPGRAKRPAPEAKARGLAIAAPFGPAPTRAETIALPSAPLPGTPAQQERGLAALRSLAKGSTNQMRESIGRVGQDIAGTVNALHLAPKLGVDVIFKSKGELDRRLWRTNRNQKKIEKMWDRLTPEQRMSFYDRFESGAAQDPILETLAVTMAKRYDNIFEAVTRYKPGLRYVDNYLKRIWRDPAKAEAVFFRNPMARRPLEGTKSFLKARVLPTIRAGLERGLELADDNPERALQAAEHDAAKFVMVHEMLLEKDSEMAKLGLFKRFPLGSRPGKGDMPEDFAIPDQRWAQTYINPETEVKEYHDKAIMEGLQSVASAIGAKTQRKIGIGGTRLGYSSAAPGVAGTIVTRFATPESVLAHEIGHAIDAKYGMRETFIRGGSKLVREELRALADLRVEGETNVSKSHRAYIRSGPEKMAVMLEALIHVPERFKEVAPTTYAKLQRFLSGHAELKPLLSIRPSLTYSEGIGLVHAGGPVLGGQYWGQRDLVRMLDNWMSRDYARGSPVGRTALEIRNRLNAMQLGLSAFHLTNVTYITTVHRLSIGLSQLARGNARGFRTMARAALAVPEYFKTGQQFFRGDPGLTGLEKDYFAGGARLHRPEHEQTSLDKAIRYHMQGRKTKAVLHWLPAAVEAPTRAIMAFTERLQVGAFQELFANELERRADDLAAGRVTREELARLAVRDVQDRLGILNYDNLFWNNTLKTAVMLLIRAPGWTLGSARTLGAAAFVDLPRAAIAPFRGEVPAFTPRMSYALAFLLAHLGMGAVYQYLHTGKRPEKLEDYIHPENGVIDENGQPQRVTFPTDLRTAESWTRAAGGILRGEHDAGARAARAVITGPIPVAINEFMNNQTYRGPVRNPNDPAYKQAEDVLKWMFGTVTPISVGIAGQQKNAPPLQRGEAFFGITPRGTARDVTRVSRRRRGHGLIGSLVTSTNRQASA